jgi:hypothetical protein
MTLSYALQQSPHRLQFAIPLIHQKTQTFRFVSLIRTSPEKSEITRQMMLRK